jgi:hypothetical protein
VEVEKEEEASFSASTTMKVPVHYLIMALRIRHLPRVEGAWQGDPRWVLLTVQTTYVSLYKLLRCSDQYNSQN